ncbi:hypothetical protein CSC2_40760 [Clostridium zeae]|uniref:Uncharacterized protein n=1 Tax=Clostridium zeae TaxID=2759022 RepID=A0ABQ1EFE2_9CLOT|nr:hypothetical protein CSC2_40760 [Clostridium zeae]
MLYQLSIVILFPMYFYDLIKKSMYFLNKYYKYSIFIKTAGINPVNYSKKNPIK